MAKERAGRKGKRYVGVDLPTEDYRELERLAAESDSSIGRLVRMGVKMLVRAHRKWDELPNATGDADRVLGSLPQDPSPSDFLSLGLVQKSRGTPTPSGPPKKIEIEPATKMAPSKHHLKINLARNRNLPIAAKRFVDKPKEKK
jgi:hypothetical protein